MTTEPESGAFSATDHTGILHLKKDVNGLIWKKYDILINEFKRHGIDLLAIGNRIEVSGWSPCWKAGIPLLLQWILLALLLLIGMIVLIRRKGK